MSAPPVLAFSGHRHEDFAVSDPDGVVARMDVALLGSGFRVVDAAGAPLCRGEVVFGSFGRRWAVTDGQERPLLGLGVGLVKTATVTFADGRTHEIRGRVFSQEWSMVDERNATVLRAVPTGNPFGFAADAWVVQQDGSLDLAQFVAVVQTHRRVVQKRRAAAAT